MKLSKQQRSDVFAMFGGRCAYCGEPPGERPNSYSENDEMTLPNSRIVISYSTKYYQFLDEDVPAFLPDKRIDPQWDAFKAGRDPVMEWNQIALAASVTAEASF